MTPRQEAMMLLENAYAILSGSVGNVEERKELAPTMRLINKALRKLGQTWI